MAERTREHLTVPSGKPTFARSTLLSLSLGLLGCATLSLVPLGCSAKIVHPATSEGPRVPDATAERLRECIDELSGDLRGGFYAYEYTVRVDEDGQVLDVATNVRDPNVAGCTRLALRAMTVPDVVFRLRPAGALARTHEQAAAERALVGNPAAAAVVVALGELIIQAGGITIVFAISVEVVWDAVARKKKPSCTDHLSDCLMSELAGKKGDHPKATLCHACWLQCKKGEWPKEIPLGDQVVSCKYKRD